MKKTLKAVLIGILVTAIFMAVFFATNLVDQQTGLHTNDTVRMTIMLVTVALYSTYWAMKSKRVNA